VSGFAIVWFIQRNAGPEPAVLFVLLAVMVASIAHLTLPSVVLAELTAVMTATTTYLTATVSYATSTHAATTIHCGTQVFTFTLTQVLTFTATPSTETTLVATGMTTSPVLMTKSISQTTITTSHSTTTRPGRVRRPFRSGPP